MLNLFFLCFVACDVIDSFTKSPAERLIDMRTERTQMMDTLYASYGGSDISNEVKKETDKAIKEEKKGSGKGFLNMIKNTVSEADRGFFEAHCLTLGNGERPSTITEKAKEFFEKPENVEACKDIALLDIKISELQLQVSGEAQP